MKKLLAIGIITIMSAMGICCSISCYGEENNAIGLNSDSTLVVYYSQTGATKRLGDAIGSTLGCRIMEIEAETPYPADYGATIERWQKELRDGVKVALKPVDVDIKQYSTIFIGAPIWGGVYALPLQAWIESADFTGKRVITFATFGSGGTATATKDVVEKLPGVEVIEGFGLRNARIARAEREARQFLVSRGFIEGEKVIVPEYSATRPVTEKESQIFEEACGNYPFPLGTPITVSERRGEEGMDYRFDVESFAPDGSPTKSVIYITVIPGSKPEFTEVVR